MSINLAVRPTAKIAIPLAGAVAAAAVAAGASTFVYPGLVGAAVLGLIVLLPIRANVQLALVALAFSRAILEGTHLLPLTNVSGYALGPGDILTLAYFGGAIWYLATKVRAGTISHLWRAPTVVPVLIFLAMASFSLLYSPAPILGLRDIVKFLSAYSVFLLLVVDRPDSQRLRLLLIGIAVGSVLPIAVGFGQLFVGGAQTNEFHGWARVQSVFISPNTYGFYLVTVLAAAWALRGQVFGKARVWLDVLSLAAFASVFLTLSRNSMAALAVLVMVVGFRHGRILILALTVAVIVMLAAPQVTSRGSTVFADEEETTETTSLGRVSIWESGLQLWRERPFLGVGFGATSVSVGHNAHNDYLRSLVESGFVGLVCFLAVMVSIVLLGRAGFGRRDGPRVLIALSFVFPLVSFSSNSLGKGGFQFHFWLLAGILYVWAERIPISRPSSPPASQNGAVPLQLRVRLNDGRTVEGFARSDMLFDDGLLLLTSVTHTFDSEMNEVVTTPLDASIAHNQVADFLEVIEERTTPPPATGEDLSPQEPESQPDDEETLHVRLLLRDGRTIEGLARGDAELDVDGVLMLTRVLHVFDSDMNEHPAIPLDGVIPCEGIVDMQEVAGAPTPSPVQTEGETGRSEPEAKIADAPITAASRHAPDLPPDAPPRDALALGALRMRAAQTRVRKAHISLALLGSVAVVLVALVLASALSNNSDQPASATGSQSPGQSSAPVTLGGAEEIAFLRDVSGVPQIHLLELTGGRPVPLAPSDTEQQRPDFSSDGNKLTYAAKAEDRLDIFVFDADGTSSINVTNNDSVEYVPDFSPDGQSITFASNLVDDFDIYVLDLPSGESRALVDNDAQDTSPAWSPDGETIAFASRMDGDFEIYTVPSDGSENPVRVTNNTVDDRAPEWSPDGTMLAYDRTFDGDTEIFITALGAEGRQITDNGVEDRHPAWSPDGEGIFFGRESLKGHELVFKSLEPGSHRVLVEDAPGGYDPAVR